MVQARAASPLGGTAKPARGAGRSELGASAAGAGGGRGPLTVPQRGVCPHVEPQGAGARRGDGCGGCHLSGVSGCQPELFQFRFLQRGC